MMKGWEYKSSGIPDDLFIRGDVPMTKEEVRAVVISKLRLKSNHIVYDIGAGTGSISIEAALQGAEAKVYAVERKSEGIKLIKKNIDKFQIGSIEVINGSAPEVLDNLPAPDRVIIGGSGGYLGEILVFLNERLNQRGRIVITAVTINTLSLAVEKLGNLHYEIDVCGIAVTRTKKVSNYHMFQAQNPIYIISAEKKKD